MSPLPILCVERRAQILKLPATSAVHDRLLAQMPFLAEAEVVAPPVASAPSAGAFRVIAWNAERCKRPEAAARFLAGQQPDLLLLTEMDWGMARSGQLHTARELAGRLSCGYAFAVEFVELGLGDERERARLAGQQNEVGYHGAAILFRRQPLAVKVIRLETSGGWFDGGRGERRVGGRLALAARFPLSGQPVTFAAVHLESDTDPEDRANQMRVLLEGLESLGPGEPALIGGDLNSFSMSHSRLQDDEAVRRALVEDPRRLVNPVAHEPLFALAQQYGYEWEPANQPGVPTQRLSPVASSGRQLMKIDWFLVRGLQPSSPQVLQALDPQDGDELSDHEALALTVSARHAPSVGRQGKTLRR